MPRVSVVIPTHNRADLLREAIASVRDQTFADWEIIVVDDHSNDHTREVVESFGDNRVRYIQNEGKNGPSVARNLGIANARGDCIAFLDDDDEWLPHKLDRQIAILDDGPETVCGIYGNRLMVDKHTGCTLSDDPGADTLSGNLLDQLMIKNPIHTSTLVVRKRCLDKVGPFDETMRYMEDRDLWIRLAQRWEFEYVEEPLIKAYIHGTEHLSLNLAGQTQGREILLSRYRHLLKKHRKSWADLYVCLGAQHCQLGNMAVGRKNLVRGLAINPFNKVGYFHLLSSLLGKKAYGRIRSVYKSTTLE